MRLAIPFHQLVQNSYALRRIGGAVGKAIDQRIETRIVARQPGVAQPERRRQGGRVGIAQPLIGTAVLVEPVHDDLDGLVLVRHRKGRDLIAATVDPFRALARTVDAPRHDALPRGGLGRQPDVMDRMAEGWSKSKRVAWWMEKRMVRPQSSRNCRPISSFSVAMSPRSVPRNFARPTSNTWSMRA